MIFSNLSIVKNWTLFLQVHYTLLLFFGKACKLLLGTNNVYRFDLNHQNLFFISNFLSKGVLNCVLTLNVRIGEDNQSLTQHWSQKTCALTEFFWKNRPRRTVPHYLCDGNIGISHWVGQSLLDFRILVHILKRSFDIMWDMRNLFGIFRVHFKNGSWYDKFTLVYCHSRLLW